MLKHLVRCDAAAGARELERTVMRLSARQVSNRAAVWQLESAGRHFQKCQAVHGLDHHGLPDQLSSHVVGDPSQRVCGQAAQVERPWECFGEVLVEDLDEVHPAELATDAQPLIVAGHIRELRAEVLRWTVFCDEEVSLADLSPAIRGAPAKTVPTRNTAVCPLAQSVAETERGAIEAALHVCGGNLASTARTLEIDRNTLKRKIKAFGLARDSRQTDR